MQGVSGSNPLGSISKIKPVFDRFLTARQSRFFDAEKLNIFFDTQKVGVAHGRGCFIIRYFNCKQILSITGCFCSANSGVDLDGFQLELNAIWSASSSALKSLEVIPLYCNGSEAM